MRGSDSARLPSARSRSWTEQHECAPLSSVADNRAVSVGRSQECGRSGGVERPSEAVTAMHKRGRAASERSVLRLGCLGAQYQADLRGVRRGMSRRSGGSWRGRLRAQARGAVWAHADVARLCLRAKQSKTALQLLPGKRVRPFDSARSAARRGCRGGDQLARKTMASSRFLYSRAIT